MKDQYTMNKILFFLSFLLLNSFLCSAAEEPNPVRDIDGKELRAGQQYNILSVIRGAGGGGLTLGGPVNASEICPLTVVQEPLDVLRGTPVTFTPVNPKKGVIRVSTDLNIIFNAITICIESNVWRLEYAEEIGQDIVVTNGVAGNPGPETLSNWFKIEEYNGDYKLVFCPTVCDFCKPICGDLGIYFDQDGTRRLALSDKPFLAQFKKAEEDD